MVALCAGGATVDPGARQAQVPGALAADVVIAEMEIEELGVGGDEGTVSPSTSGRIVHDKVGEVVGGRRRAGLKLVGIV